MTALQHNNTNLLVNFAGFLNARFLTEICGINIFASCQMCKLTAFCPNCSQLFPLTA